MSTAKQRREQSRVNFLSDLELIAEAERDGDVVKHYDTLSRMAHRMHNSEDYAQAAVVTKNSIWHHSRVLSKMEELYPAAEALKADAKWAKYAPMLASMAKEEANKLTKLGTDIAEAIEKGYKLTQVMEWSEKYFIAAAKADVYATVVQYCATIDKKTEAYPTSADKWRALTDEINANVLRFARNRPASSSATSNLSEACVCAAWAEVAEGMKWHVHI